MDTGEPVQPHEAFHAPAAHSSVLAQDQLGMDPPCAVGPASLPVDVDDYVQQVGVIDIAC